MLYISNMVSIENTWILGTCCIFISQSMANKTI